MPKATHLLSNVVPEAVSIVRKGANGQTFFLRKSDGTVLDAPAAGAEALIVLPRVDEDAPAPVLMAKADWSAVYCVVAAPDVVENGGMLDPDVWDQWASADEIRKAAHAFMRNGGLVNQMHADLEPYGTVVENAIALADLDVDGSTISKGSWYIAIEPTEEGRDLIEKGEFTGVSLQGSGSRAVAKADPKAQGTKGKDRASGTGTYKKCPGCGGKVSMGRSTCHNCGAQIAKLSADEITDAAGEALGIPARELLGVDEEEIAKAKAPLANKPDKTNYIEQGGGFPKELRDLIEEIKGSGSLKDSEAIARGISVMRKYAAGRAAHGTGKISAAKAAKWKAVLAEYEALPAKAKAKNAMKKETGMSRLMVAMAKAIGLDPTAPEFAEEEVDVVKAAAVATFAQRIAAREVEDDLPLAMDALRGAIYDAIYPFAYGYSDPPTPASARGALDESLQQFHDHMLTVFDNVTSGSIAKSEDELRADLATLGMKEATAGGKDHQEDDDMADETKIEKLEGDVKSLTEKLDSFLTGFEPIAKRLKEATEPAPTVEDLSKSVSELAGQLQTIAKGVERLGEGGSNQGDDGGGKTRVSKSDDPLVGLLD